MTKEMRELFQEVLNTSEREKACYAREAFLDLTKGMKKSGTSDENITYFILLLVKLLVSADQVCDIKEYNFFVKTTGIHIEKEKFFELTNGGANPSFKEEMMETLAKFGEEELYNVAQYAIAFLACDSELNRGELMLLDEIFSLNC